MINAKKAFELAKREIDGLLASRDTLFLPWVDGRLVSPVIVNDIIGRPSYWLVPFEAGGHAVGFVRVSAAGEVLSAGVFSHDPKKLSQCPKVGTGISVNEAYLKASENIDASVEVADVPVFVHDGPVGREVWLVEVSRSGRPHRWLFVSSTGVYERPAGEILDNGLEA